MTGLAALLTKSALDAALAGTAAKGTLDLSKEDKKQKVLGDSVELKDQLMEDEKVKETPKESPKKSKKNIDKDALAVTLAMGGLSGPEVKQVMKTGVLSEKMLKKLDKDVFQDIEDITGVSVFPTGEKPEGTPPVTSGTTVKKQTRTESPDGDVKETTTTFDSNSGVKKTTKTEIPEDDELKKLLSNIDFVNSKDFEQHPRIQEYLDKKGLKGEERAKAIMDLVRNANTNVSLKSSRIEARDASKRWIAENARKRIEAPKDKVVSLSPAEKAMADNRHFDEGQSKADAERRAAEEVAKRASQIAPKFDD